MASSIDEYNARVEPEQRAQGALPTVEPLGSRMDWRAWQGVEHRTTPEANE